MKSLLVIVKVIQWAWRPSSIKYATPHYRKILRFVFHLIIHILRLFGFLNFFRSFPIFSDQTCCATPFDGAVEVADWSSSSFAYLGLPQVNGTYRQRIMCLICLFIVTQNNTMKQTTNNEFITCFSQILNHEILCFIANKILILGKVGFQSDQITAASWSGNTYLPKTLTQKLMLCML